MSRAGLRSTGWLLPTVAVGTLLWVLSACSQTPGQYGEPDATCGDGVRQPVEQCEGDDLGGQSCEGLGLGNGTLVCHQCLFDVTGCESCGNGQCEPGESRLSCPPDCGVRVLATGQGHACAALGDGTVWCWGANQNSEIGNDTLRWSHSPILVAGVENAVDLCASVHHSCALLSDGTARCWGYNGGGMLGVDYPELEHTASPVQVEGLDDGASITCGGSHTCVRTASNLARCWGGNHYGQLGDGNMGQNSHTPVTVVSLVDVVDVVAMESASCAALADGTVWCWGLGDAALGTGLSPMPNVDVPVQVVGIDDAWKLGQGTGLESLMCAIRQDRTLWCWGSNFQGTLGTGTTDSFAAAPVWVESLTDVQSFSLAQTHACASTADGSAYCWGALDGFCQFGQLGNAITGSGVPVPVNALQDASWVAVGGTFSCAVRAGGTAWCWGNNLWGELGIGNTEPVRSVVPLQVVFP